MILFVVSHYQTDECTYSLEVVHAVCTDEVEAIKAQGEAQKHTRYEVEIKEIESNKVYETGI